MLRDSRSSRRIVTVTANTALDHVIVLERLDPGRVLVAKSAEVSPSGKGVNVARIASVLGAPAVVLGLVASRSADVFQALESDRLKINLTPVAGWTRTNVTILDLGQKLQTHIKTPGPTIRHEWEVSLESEVTKTVREEDVVVLAGSAPIGTSEDFYERMVRQVKSAGASVILDASGHHLLSGLRGGPDVVKPNVRELAEFVGRTLDGSTAGIVEASQELLTAGAERVVTSRAARGAIMVERGGESAINGIVPLDVPIVSTVGVGCGDAMVAGLAFGMLDGRSWESTLRLGLACGTAKLQSVGPGACRLEDVERLLGSVKLTRV